MAAYLLVELEVHDAAAYEPYKTAVPALVQKHGGEYLIRGGAVRVIEGDWQPERLVVFRFPSLDAIHAFFADPDYEPLRQLRQRVATTRAIAVEGVA